MIARKFGLSVGLALALATLLLLPGWSTPVALAQDPVEAAAACTADFKQKWMPKGNCKTNPANHFLGTLDNQPLVFKTNAAERMRIDAGGKVGIGTTSPGFKLDVADRIRVRQGSALSAGIWLHQKTPNNDRAFLGMADDTHVGIYGANGAGWSLVADTTNGNISIGQTSTCCARVTIRVPDSSPSNEAVSIVNESGFVLLDVENDGSVRVGKLRDYNTTNTYEYVCYDKSFGRLSRCSLGGQAAPGKDSTREVGQLRGEVDALMQENRVLKQENLELAQDLASIEERLAALERILSVVTYAE